MINQTSTLFFLSLILEKENRKLKLPKRLIELSNKDFQRFIWSVLVLLQVQVA